MDPLADPRLRDFVQLTKAVQKIIEHLSSHENTYTHSRHIPMAKCIELGLKIVRIEEDQKLQDEVLTTHHAFMYTFQNTCALKIIENHGGVAYVEHLHPREA
jgi:hypothetical protein